MTETTRPGQQLGRAEYNTVRSRHKAFDRILFRSATAAGLASIITGLPWLFSGGAGGDLIGATGVVLVHALLLWWVAAHTTKQGLLHGNALRPSAVAGVTFGVFHIVLNFYVLSDPFILGLRGLDWSSGSGLLSDVYVSYLVVSVAWAGYILGFSATWSQPRRLGPRMRRRSPGFAIVGVLYVTLGAVGNAVLLGGVGQYLRKIPHFYERWSEYEQASVFGATKYQILMRFLPVGLLVTTYGYWVWRRRRQSLFPLLLGAGAANILLSNATGSRSSSLMVFFFGVIAYDVAVRQVQFRHVMIATGILVPVVTALGGLRAASYFGVNTDWAAIFTGPLFTRFASQTFTNYLGTLTLVHHVQEHGVEFGRTAFAGITGLLGGPTPLTTQAAVWLDLTGNPDGPNARYGPPGELYYNFGLIGVFAGMAGLGWLVRHLNAWYDTARREPSTAGVVAAIFAVMTAHFIMIANLSYIPPYFTYFMLPYAGVFLLLRKVDC